MGLVRRVIGFIMILVGGYALYTFIPDIIVALVQFRLNETFAGQLANTAFVTFGVFPSQPELIFIDVGIYSVIVIIGLVLLLKGNAKKIIPIR